MYRNLTVEVNWCITGFPTYLYDSARGMYRNVNIAVKQTDGDTLSQSDCSDTTVDFVTAALIGLFSMRDNYLRMREHPVAECMK